MLVYLLSLTKYRLIIEEYGSYDLFQSLLSKLHIIARKHKAGIAEVAARYMLQKPLVGGIIIGARNRNHLDKLSKIQSFTLDQDDLSVIEEMTKKSNGPAGPVYDLERDKNGPHGAIMRYNLNGQNTK